MSASNRRRNRAITGADERVARAIGLLELLSSVEDGIVSAEEAAQHLGCTDAELDTAIDLIATLADRETGARAIIFRDHGDIVLAGDGARLMPLRLSLGEGAVLAHVMQALSLPTDVRDRLARALLPAELSEEETSLVASTTSYGDVYPALVRAAAEHERVHIAYRAHGEQTATVRVVEPLRIETNRDGAYLVARNVEHATPHRYRLERISSVELTGEHATPQSTDNDVWDEELAELEVAPGAKIPAWRGIETIDDVPSADGTRRISVHVSSPSWLFDQVLAAGGNLTIVGPEHVVDAFRAYAQELLEEPTEQEGQT